MITEQIRQLILGASLHHDADKSLAYHLQDVLSNQGLALDQESLEQAVSLVTEYVNQVPIVLEQTILSAEHAAELDTILPLLESCVMYFFEPVDFIPDRHGLFGLFDDAYLTLRMLEKINQTYFQETGAFLLPLDLAPANNVVRHFLGNTLAERMDTEIDKAVSLRKDQVKQTRSEHAYNARNEESDKRWGHYFEDDVAQFFARHGQPLSYKTAQINSEGIKCNS